MSCGESLHPLPAPRSLNSTIGSIRATEHLFLPIRIQLLTSILPPCPDDKLFERESVLGLLCVASALDRIRAQPQVAEVDGGEASGGPSSPAISDLPVLPKGHRVWAPGHTRGGGIPQELSGLGLRSWRGSFREGKG